MHPRTLGMLLLAIVALLGVWAWLFVSGTILVVDRSGYLARADVVTGYGTRELRRLPGGIWVGLPDGDGTVQLVCRDGSTREYGYVTRVVHVWLDVGRGGRCGTIKPL